MYLNNKCSKEQPKAWSVVRRKTKILYHCAANWKRCPLNTPNEVRHKSICVFIYLTHQLSGICHTVSFSGPLVWPKRRLSVKLKGLDQERFLCRSIVQTQGLTRSKHSCTTVAHHANCLQKAKSSMLSISSKQFTGWRKSNNSGNGGDGDIKVWRVWCKFDRVKRILYYSPIMMLNYADICHLWTAFCESL